MAITPPAFQKDAVPSLKGWHHPKTNELLKSTRHTQAQIDEFNGITAVESPIAIEIAEVVEDVVTLRWEQPVVIAEGIRQLVQEYSNGDITLNNIKWPEPKEQYTFALDMV